MLAKIALENLLIFLFHDTKFSIELPFLDFSELLLIVEGRLGKKSSQSNRISGAGFSGV